MLNSRISHIIKPSMKSFIVAVGLTVSIFAIGVLEVKAESTPDESTLRAVNAFDTNGSNHIDAAEILANLSELFQAFDPIFSEEDRKHDYNQDGKINATDIIIMSGMVEDLADGGLAGFTIDSNAPEIFAAFFIVDTNHDYILSEEELNEAIAIVQVAIGDVPIPATPDVEEAVKIYDFNKDGIITAADLAILQKIKGILYPSTGSKTPEEFILNAINTFDTNGNTHIDATEFLTNLSESLQSWDPIFSEEDRKHDYNEDGKINASDLIIMDAMIQGVANDEYSGFSIDSDAQAMWAAFVVVDTNGNAILTEEELNEAIILAEAVIGGIPSPAILQKMKDALYPEEDTSGDSSDNGGNIGDSNDEDPDEINSNSENSSGQVAGTQTATQLRPAETVRRLFNSVYNRNPNAEELLYWRGRVDKKTQPELIGAMQWHHARGVSLPGAQSNSNSVLPSMINQLMRQVGIVITPLKNEYWVSRIPEKPTIIEMLGAMQWHHLNRTPQG